MARICDNKTYGLRQRNRVFTEFVDSNEYFRKKPGFWAPCVSPDN